MDNKGLTEEPEIVDLLDENEIIEAKKKSPRRRVKEAPHPCNECSRICRTASQLQRHLRTHTGERPYLCNMCGKKYTNSGHLKTHMLSHGGTKDFHCTEPECKSSFYRKTELDQHLKSHAGEKTHLCQLCSKRFVLGCNLYMHLKTHGDKPHECKICCKKFLTRGRLRSHLSTRLHEKKMNRQKVSAY